VAILPVLAVVFVGIGGDDAARVDKQMSALLHKDANVATATVAPGELRTLARHGDGARAIVRGLHADGVVAGEVVSAHGHVTLRVIVYDGDGRMTDLVETPLSGRALTRGDLDVLRSNLMPDVLALVHATPSEDRDADGGGDKDDAPAEDPKAALPATSGETMREHDAAPTETADASGAVSADEALALATGGESDGVSADTSPDEGLRIRAALGFGLTGRGFSPGPMSVAGYASAPVGAVRVDAEIRPTARTSLALVGERALGMTTPGLADGNAPTTLSRWQVSAAYALVHGAVRLAPLVGVGGRDFGIASKDPSRAPDSHYAYVVAGAALSTSIGSRVSLAGLAAVEPVFGGDEPTEMAFGEASRWALELGASVEVRATEHLFVRGSASWQRFSWTWDDAGARGAGGAIDSYPAGTLSLGADY